MYNNYDNYLKFTKAEYKSEQTTQTKKLYIWRSKDDDKVRAGHAEYDDRIFDWDSDMIKPGEDFGCRCYAEFIETNLDGNLKIGDKVNSSNAHLIHTLGTVGKISHLNTGEEVDSKYLFEKEETIADTLEHLEKEEDKIKALNEFIESDELIKYIEEAHKIKNKDIATKLSWMYSNFKTGGRFDLKRNNPRMEHAGNFNYGVIGRAAGFYESDLIGGAGLYQLVSLTSSLSFWPSYFDDPIDHKYIKKGMEYYNKNYGHILWE